MAHLHKVLPISSTTKTLRFFIINDQTSNKMDETPIENLLQSKMCNMVDMALDKEGTSGQQIHHCFYEQKNI